MSVSIIVPTYKRPDLLINCVYSLINQSYRGEYEIIIVDNFGADNTFELYKAHFEHNHKVNYHLEQRQGLVFSRHTGLRLSKFNVLIFVDDDGEYDYHCIEEICKVYSLYPEVQAVGGKILIKWDHRPPVWVNRYEPLLGRLDYGNQTIVSSSLFINGGLFSIKKETLTDLGGFNPDQVGDYLVGDGETGLCKKMHQRNLLIGWTPFAVMHHLQSVQKNGTKEDIARRYYNNGIGEIYHLFEARDFKPNFSLYLRYATACFLFVVITPLAFISRRLFFYRHFFWGTISFYKLWNNPEYKKQVQRNDWF